MQKSQHGNRSGTRPAGASEPYVADTSDKKLARRKFCRNKTSDTCGMRCGMAFSEPYNISYMRNESTSHNPQYLF